MCFYLYDIKTFTFKASTVLDVVSVKWPQVPEVMLYSLQFVFTCLVSSNGV